jgi:hypothetical protein
MRDLASMATAPGDAERLDRRENGASGVAYRLFPWVILV